MPPAIPPEMRLKILFLHREGRPYCAIAQALGISRQTVFRWIARHRQTGDLQENARTGRPRSTDAAQDEALIDALIQQPEATARDVCERHPFPYRTGLRRIGEAGMKLRVMKKREAALQDAQKRAQRVEWAERADREWRDWSSSTVWVDETMCESKLTHRKRAWFDARLRASDRPAHFVRGCGRISVGIFGGLCDGQLLPLVIIHGGFNAAQYRAILEGNYWPELQTKFDFSAFRLIHDNASAHKARAVREWAEEEAPELAAAFWPLPAYSPDLNPIEHVWARLKKKLNQRPSCRSRAELIQNVREIYEEIGQESRFLRALCNSMPRRINAVIAADGGPTRY